MKGILGLSWLLMSVITFILFYSDKAKAVRGRRRITEKKLLTLSFFGGALGALLAMYSVRHKNRKMKFKLLVPLFALLHLFLAYQVCVYF